MDADYLMKDQFFDEKISTRHNFNIFETGNFSKRALMGLKVIQLT